MNDRNVSVAVDRRQYNDALGLKAQNASAIEEEAEMANAYSSFETNPAYTDG